MHALMQMQMPTKRMTLPAGDGDLLRVVSLQTKGDGHYRYYCPFACQASAGTPGGILHKPSRIQLEQHLLTAHLSQMQQLPTAEILYAAPTAVRLAPKLGLLFAQLVPLSGTKCRVDLAARMAKEVQRTGRCGSKQCLLQCVPGPYQKLQECSMILALSTSAC